MNIEDIKKIEGAIILDLEECGSATAATEAIVDQFNRYGQEKLYLNYGPIDDPESDIKSMEDWSKHLSAKLRWDINWDTAEKAAGRTGYTEDGFRDVESLLHAIPFYIIDALVQTGERFEWNSDKTAVRSLHGHDKRLNICIGKDISLAEVPEILYHGTTTTAYDKIKVEGLKPMKRKHVHCQIWLDKAEEISTRHIKHNNAGEAIDEPIILTIAAKEASITGGTQWQKSIDGVYLTSFVPPEYINILK